MKELGGICDNIPHDQLAIQFDVAAEFMHLEGVALSKSWFGETYDEQLDAVSSFHNAYFNLSNLPHQIVERMTRFAAAVPEDVDIGFHLCYGTSPPTYVLCRY